jgi:hypothetical protein
VNKTLLSAVALAVLVAGCATSELELGEQAQAISTEPDASASTSEFAAAAATSEVPEEDPFGFAGKRTSELDELIAAEKAAGPHFHSLSKGAQARLEALYRARSKRLGKRPLEERLVFVPNADLEEEVQP